MKQPVAPETVGLSSERLDKISTWLDDQVSNQCLAGCSVLLGRRGEIPYFHSSGHADIALGKTFNRDSILRIYSMTKSVTTVAAMMLYEDGHFQLDDALSKYIPAFADTTVWLGGELTNTAAQQQPILIRHLMSHTAGLTYGFMYATPVDAEYRAQRLEFLPREALLAEQVEKLASIPLICQPGSQWNYSVASDVLGRLVEIWSGQTLAEFFAERIFGPLAMQSTGFHVEEQNHQRFAALYSPLSGGAMSSVNKVADPSEQSQRGGLKQMESSAGSVYLKPASLLSGGGGLTSTIDDYGRFCQMLLNRGELEGERLLGRKTVEYMQKNQLPENRDMAAMGQPVWSETSYDGIGFGLGFAVVLDPVKAAIITSKGEYHWGGAASTFFWIDPEEDLWAVFFTQLMPSSTYPVRRELRSLVYQAIVD